jgi:hypothetical protein
MSKADAGGLDKRAFLIERVQQIPGWLIDFTAMRTMDLLDWQDEQAIKGSFLEIGVFRGRYFSILLRSAGKSGATAVGVDTFQWNSIAELREHMVQAVGDVAFKAIQSFSSALTARDLLAALRAPSRFVSIDGSHDYEDVLWDMQLAEGALGSDGIIAADDFVNPLCLGVNQAINEYLSSPKGIVPFAYIANKLFLCRRHMHDRYLEVIEKFVLADTEDFRGTTFAEQRKLKRENCFTRFSGSELLVVC